MEVSKNEKVAKLLGQYPAHAKAHRVWQPKPSGALRPIAVPNEQLAEWLETANHVLRSIYGDWLPCMHGGIKKHSYISYAQPHVGRDCVITIDIRDCFNSINMGDIATTFTRYLGLNEKTALELADRVCYRGRLAQGFATSNFVCNLYLLQPLARLSDLFGLQALILTNYVDDIAVSGIIEDPSKVINEVARELSKAKLAISKGKIHIMPSYGRQVICGLIVNKRLSLTKAKKLELYSAVARGAISPESVAGWISHLNTIDPSFQRKFQAYAYKKGLLKPTIADML